MKALLRRCLEAFGLIPRVEIVAVISFDYPEQRALAPGVLHVVGGKGYQKWAYFSCPCRCGAPIMLSLSANRRPRWRVKIDCLDRPTVEPSVWQTDGCHSHFWVKQGRIEWVGDSGKRPPPGYPAA